MLGKAPKLANVCVGMRVLQKGKIEHQTKNTRNEKRHPDGAALKKLEIHSVVHINEVVYC